MRDRFDDLDRAQAYVERGVDVNLELRLTTAKGGEHSALTASIKRLRSLTAW